MQSCKVSNFNINNWSMRDICRVRSIKPKTSTDWQELIFAQFIITNCIQCSSKQKCYKKCIKMSNCTKYLSTSTSKCLP